MDHGTHERAGASGSLCPVRASQERWRLLQGENSGMGLVQARVRADGSIRECEAYYVGAMRAVEV